MKAFTVPCCCNQGPGGVGCDIFSDNFIRADDTDIGADWTEVSGSWAIVSNELRCTSSGKVVAVETPVQSAVTVTAGARASTGDRVRVMIGYSDSSNYLYGEVHYNGAASVVRVVRVAGGVSSVLDTSSTFTLSTGDGISLTVCLTESNVLAAKVSPTIVAAGRASPPGSQIGLEAVVSSQVNFSSFASTYVSDDCEECEAPGDCDFTACCTSNDADLEYDLTIGSGWSNDDCGSCDISGIYTLGLTQRGACIWEFIDANFCARTTACPTSGVGVCTDWDLYIGLGAVSDVNGCRWQLDIMISTSIAGTACGAATCNKYSRATYYSAYRLASDPCHITSPVTLTLDTETHEDNGGGVAPCSGGLPNEVTIQSA